MKRDEEFRSLVEEAMAGLPMEQHDPADGLPLQVVPFGAPEVLAVLDVLLSTWVTMGKEVATFEKEWATFCGAEHGVMVNSGSSANLVALAGLVQQGVLEPGDEVLVPAVSWSTSLFPVAQLGLRPVLVDIDPDTLCLSVASCEEALGPRTRGAVSVHLLGQAAPVRELEALGLVVMEDACAAPGAEIDGARVGGQGRAGTFSFFFSHHITTGEGGMLVTSDSELADLARSLRAHGWVREMSGREAVAARHPEIDDRFLFLTPGWNLRPTEMAAAMGRCQLQRLEAWTQRRRQNHQSWCKKLSIFASELRVFPERSGTRHAAFAFPMLLQGSLAGRRKAFSAHLESRGIQTRPISGSNLARQPAFARIPGARIAGSLQVADDVHTHGLFVGNSHAFSEGHGDLLVNSISEFLNA